MKGDDSMSQKIHEIVTNKIIEELEKGVIPWHKPWSGLGRCINYKSRKSYSFLNEMLLHKPGEYLTFKQVEELGGKVLKGEKASIVTFWKILPVEERNDKGEVIKKKIPLLRYYNVFHLDQTEGIQSKVIENDKEFNDIQCAETVTSDYFTKHKIDFMSVAGNRAYYSPAVDRVVMPLKKQFDSENEYYNVLFHETVHSTGHSSRLKRITDTSRFGDEEYSKEELVAEIGAATLMNTFGIDNSSTLKNSVAYIQSWLGALRNDKSLIISASSRAGKAVNMILEKEIEEYE
jgi:antirestriction protein ArdC